MNWKRFDLGKLILLGTLLISVPRYAAAFSQAEPTFLGLTIAPVTGLGFGLLLELGIYFVIDSWFDARRRGLKLSWMLLVGFVVQLVIAPVIIAPAIVGHLSANNSELAGVLTWPPALWAWAVVAAGAPALLLAAVAGASYLRTPASKKRKPSVLGPEDPGDSKPEAEPASKTRFVCEVCGRGFRSQPALNAHMRAHVGSNGNGPAGEPVESEAP